MSVQPWTLTSYPEPQRFPANAWRSRAVQMAHAERMTESWSMRPNPRPWVTSPVTPSHSRLRSRVVNPSIHRSPQARDARPSDRTSSWAGASASCVL